MSLVVAGLCRGKDPSPAHPVIYTPIHSESILMMLRSNPAARGLAAVLLLAATAAVAVQGSINVSVQLQYKPAA